MENREKTVSVYHATPLCRKCKDELSRVERASSQEGAKTRVVFSLWKRIKYGIRLLNMPVVVVNDRPFSVLGAFGEEALASELKRKGSA